MKLGLNDPTSPNYIKDTNKRLRVAAEMMKAQLAELSKHTIELDFCNEYGQHVYVITCSIMETTFAVTDRECKCGSKI